MKKIIKSMSFGLIISVLLCLVPFEGECREISDKVFRIHILANSDSKEDQSLKLKVRDAILKKSEELFLSAQNKGDAKEIAQKNLGLFKDIAQQVVYDNGYTYSVTASVRTMYFSTRYYDEVTMPSGVYDALQIRIGKAEGKNWWCVMYPSLCLSAAGESSPLKEELTPSQYSIVTKDGKYEFRFKTVEIFNRIIDFFSR